MVYKKNKGLNTLKIPLKLNYFSPVKSSLHISSNYILKTDQMSIHYSNPSTGTQCWQKRSKLLRMRFNTTRHPKPTELSIMFRRVFLRSTCNPGTCALTPEVPPTLPSCRAMACPSPRALSPAHTWVHTHTPYPSRFV